MSALYHRQAFTLIELLIAIAISAIVIATISTLFFSSMHLRQKASEAASQTLPTDRAIAIIKRDLLAIVPPGKLAGTMGTDAVGINTAQPPLLEIFTGSAALTDDLSWGDVQKIDYSLQPPTNRASYTGLNLMRGVTRNLLPPTAVPPDPQTLLENVQNLQFSYYDGTNWNDTWSTSLSNVPVAIRVSIDFASVKGSEQINPTVQLLVPIVTWSSTNSATNQILN